jgi:hypothetical protein
VLADQFGGYTSTKKFRDEFVKRLHEVHSVYPDAGVDIVQGQRGGRGGSLVLRPSRPPVYPVASVVPAAIGAHAEMETETRTEIRALLEDAFPEP